MTQRLFVGVDGGATKCFVRVENEAGELLGREVSGPANIRLSVSNTWDAIYAALNKILSTHDINLQDKSYEFYAGMGIAGCEVVDALQAFIDAPHGFKELIVTSDAHAACLGAHNGNDGAIVIAGTGTVGFQIDNDHVTKVAGWGFPHDDEGGGAWLGLQAVSHALRCFDGRESVSDLAKVIFTHFSNDQNALVTWANQANSTRFAELAPIVIEQAQQNETQALMLLKRAAAFLDNIAEALFKNQHDHEKILPCAMLGSIAPFLQPYLNTALQARLTPALSSPDKGAIFLIKRALQK